MDQALQEDSWQIPQHDTRRTARPRADCPADNAQFHYDDYAERDRDRHAVCEKSALPVLCLLGVGYAIPAVESGIPSDLAICIVGCAGVGMECVSEYTCELGDRGRTAGRSTAGRVVGDEERV